MYKLPLLDYVDQKFSKVDLSGCLLFASQNLLGSTEAIIDRLLDKGLLKENISIIGKAYSSSQKVIDSLREKGIYVSPLSTSFDFQLPFDQQYKQYIRDFLSLRTKNFDLSKFEKIIILDEGHRLLEIAQDFFPKEKLIGVEQSSKNEFLEQLSLAFPCITISRTKAKLFVESPMIANAVKKQLFQYLKTSNQTLHNYLIIGNGFIGRSILFELQQEGHNVKIYDHNASKSELTDHELDKYIQTSNVIISCVYGSALKDHHYDLLKSDVVLASASLSDRAFKSAEIRKQYPLQLDNCHENVSVSFNKRNLHLMNCGFPINFSGEVHSVPPNKIQITRALLLGAIYESLSKKTTGIKELSISLQDQILHSFFKIEPDSESEYKKYLNTEVGNNIYDFTDS